jgi:leucyl aminopeptidase
VPTFEVSPASPTEVQADLLMLPVFEGRVPGPGVDAVAKAVGTDLMEILKAHGGRGKLGDTFVFPTLGRIRAASVMLVGLGPRDRAGAAEVRRATMKAARSGAKFTTVASTLAQVGRDKQAAAQAFAEGVSLGAYRFDRYKHQPMDEASKEKARLKRVVTLADGTNAAVKSGLSRGEIYGDASNWARDMVNTPAIDATPSYLADQAKSMAKELGLTVKVWSKGELTRGGFGGILGVGAGSVHEPRLIELTYQGGGRRAGAPIAITGKGVTFDSGGLSIKPADAMEWMKADMGGAAAALATMRAVAKLQPKVDVIAAIPSAENLPGGSAIRPGDVLRHRGGKTSEVLNTDAEGRLILADALAYLAEKNPRVIIDSATLTGAAMIALGIDVWAVMGTDRRLIADLLAAGQAEGEPGWELPLWTDYRRHIESTVADVKNVGIRWGGAITAGLFLREFVGEIPWAHLDVAGTAFVEQGSEYWPRGATGSPARTIVRYIEDQAAKLATSTSRAKRASSGKRATTRRRG